MNTSAECNVDLAPLAALTGRELEFGLLSRTVSDVVGRAPWPTIGAVHITCADEVQQRVIDKVQHLLVEPHVTAMASGEHTAFRLVNLGGHHELGALGIAENHWAGGHDTAVGPKLMVVRADAHVGVDYDPAGNPVYGKFLRFEHSSVACGALAAVLRGVAMRGAEGFVDQEVRARRILDAFDEDTRMLAAAVCRAELSAADCLGEIRTLQPESPTVWLVLATVTLNHPDRHSSLLTSVAVVDETGAETGTGLGIDVEAYRIEHRDGKLEVQSAPPDA